MKEMYCKYYDKFVQNLFEYEECPEFCGTDDCFECEAGEFRERENDEDYET